MVAGKVFACFQPNFKAFASLDENESLIYEIEIEAENAETVRETFELDSELVNDIRQLGRLLQSENTAEN